MYIHNRHSTDIMCLEQSFVVIKTCGNSAKQHWNSSTSGLTDVNVLTVFLVAVVLYGANYMQ